jgi:hypothetical protein
MQGFDLVLYGDSITEFWRGTSGGLPLKRPDGSIDNVTWVPWDLRVVFDSTLASKYKTGVMAIAGVLSCKCRSCMHAAGRRQACWLLLRTQCKGAG